MPEINYLNSIKSHTKIKILELTEGNMDISSMKFLKLSNVIKGICRELKAHGLSDTEHYPEIPSSVLDASFRAYHCATMFAQD